MAGYYNPKKDYAAAIKAEKNPAKQAQLKAERQNKIDAMNACRDEHEGLHKQHLRRLLQLFRKGKLFLRRRRKGK